MILSSIAQSRVSTVRNQLRVLAGQALVIEHLSFAAADETRVSFYAGDESVAVTGHREAGEGPELRGLGARWHFCWAFKADDSCGTKKYGI